jgi:hypothetical protein
MRRNSPLLAIDQKQLHPRRVCLKAGPYHTIGNWHGKGKPRFWRRFRAPVIHNSLQPFPTNTTAPEQNRISLVRADPLGDLCTHLIGLLRITLIQDSVHRQGF